MWDKKLSLMKSIYLYILVVLFVLACLQLLGNIIEFILPPLLE